MIKEIKKPWGKEVIFASNELYIGKLLCITQDNRLSLQFHPEKDETMYLFSGKVEIEINNHRFILDANDKNKSIRIRPNIKHRVKALYDSIIIEVSTPHNKTIRIEDDYGR